MRCLLIGLGSIGRRHAKNLSALVPGIEIVSVDPGVVNADYKNILDARKDKSDFAFAVICSPTNLHLDHLITLLRDDIDVFCEKPILSHASSAGKEKLISAYLRSKSKVTIGYCYRFHPVVRNIKAMTGKRNLLAFSASEDLLGRYGPNVLEIMAAHPIDSALWISGPAEDARVSDAGDRCSVYIRHKSGCQTHIMCDMSVGPRESWVDYDQDGDARVSDVGICDQMYIDEMRDWLNYVKTGDRGDLCSFEEGMRVQEIMWRRR